MCATVMFCVTLTGVVVLTLAGTDFTEFRTTLNQMNETPPQSDHPGNTQVIRWRGEYHNRRSSVRS